MQCVESFHNMQLYMESANMNHKQNPWIALHEHQSQEQWYGALQATPWVHPPVHICCEIRLLNALITGWLQDNAEAVPSLSTQKCFTPLQSGLLSLAFLLSDSLTPSCNWAFLPSMRAHSSVKNYHCNWNFPFIVKIHFRIWEWSRKGRVAKNPQKGI